jgi:hypothetical protein
VHDPVLAARATASWLPLCQIRTFLMFQCFGCMNKLRPNALYSWISSVFGHDAEHSLRSSRIARLITPSRIASRYRSALPLYSESPCVAPLQHSPILRQKYPFLILETLALDDEHHLEPLVFKRQIDETFTFTTFPRVFFIEYPPSVAFLSGSNAVCNGDLERIPRAIDRTELIWWLCHWSDLIASIHLVITFDAFVRPNLWIRYATLSSKSAP